MVTMTQYFPHLDCNTLTAPAYGVYILQLIRYTRACILYFYDIQRLRDRLLSTTLLSQGFLMNRLIQSFKMFVGRYHQQKKLKLQNICFVS
jgi:hypothetical protein